MPGFLLNVGSVVMCAHGGMARPTVPNPRILVMGQPIAMISAPYTITGCAFPPPAGNGPCVTANWITGSVRVRSMGQPVLLQDSQAICTPTGTPLTIAIVQPRVKGI